MLRATFDSAAAGYHISPAVPSVLLADDTSLETVGSVPIDPFSGGAIGLGIGRNTVRLSISHCVCDRRAFEIVLADLGYAYSGDTLEPEAADFSRYVGWLANRRNAALHDTMLPFHVETIKSADWPPASSRYSAPPSSYSSCLRHGRHPTQFLAACRSHGATATAALMEAAGAALRDIFRKESVIASIPVAMRPGREFSRTIGDYTNMVVAALQEPGIAAPMRSLGLALRFSAIHLHELSALSGSEDVGRIRLDINQDAKTPLILEEEIGRVISDSEHNTTRRDLSFELALTDKHATLLCAARSGTSFPGDLSQIADSTAAALARYGF
jgi:Condensation domain